MSEIRHATLEDLRVVASWLSSPAECRLWAGSRVPFPVDVATLPGVIEFWRCLSFTLEEDGVPLAFGQLVPKSGSRLHLSRVIAAPCRRGQGLGRRLAAHLLSEALWRRGSPISLNVIPGNRRAIGLYRSLGFRPSMRPPDEPESESIYMEHRA